MRTPIPPIVGTRPFKAVLTAFAATLLMGALSCVGSSTDAAGLSPQQKLFWQNLQALCGNAYKGTLVEAPPGDTALARASFVIHFRSCNPGRMMMSLHVGDDHSRVLILTQSDSGLVLRHRHFGPGGEPEELSGYGGRTFSRGTPQHQQFVADSLTAALAPGAADNVWTLGVLPGELFAYGLRRANGGGLVRIEFDLSEAVDDPPASWMNTNSPDVGDG